MWMFAMEKMILLAGLIGAILTMARFPNAPRDRRVPARPGPRIRSLGPDPHLAPVWWRRWRR